MPDDQPPDTMNTYDIGVFLGYQGDRKTVLRSAGRWINRAGIEPVGREPGRDGLNLYPTTQVHAKKDAMPGKGAPGKSRQKRKKQE